MALNDPTVSQIDQQKVVPDLKPNTAVKATTVASPASATQEQDESEPAAYELVRGFHGDLCFIYQTKKYCPGEKFGSATIKEIKQSEITLTANGVSTKIPRFSNNNKSDVFIRFGNPQANSSTKMK